MDETLRLYAVDDDPMILDVIRSIAEPLAHVECFESAEACQVRIEEVQPDLVLLDIGLGGMDGYTYCQQLKAADATRSIPIIFVSGRDIIDDRLQGYDAGAEDFIVKPFDPQELLRKIKVAGQVRAEKQRLQVQAAAAEELSSLCLASMDEGGIVLQFMSKVIGWESETEIAEGMLELMRRFGLSCAVQTRVGGRIYTVSEAGVNLPLEVSILKHVVTLGRIFEFHNRSVYNFDWITVMVSNMPLHDQALCGRIRDNVAIAAQGADARLAAIDNAEGRQRSQKAVVDALRSLQSMLTTFSDKHKIQLALYSDFAFAMERELEHAFVHLGLTMEQERHLEGVVANRMQELLKMADQGEDLESVISSILGDLAEINSH